MALPTLDDLKGLDWVHLGQPFVESAAKSSINLNTLDYVYLGQPYVRNAYSTSYPFTLSAAQDNDHIDLTWTEP